MADELKSELGVDATLIPGHGGVFEVTIDGKAIFSKKSAGRFPNDGEIAGMLRAKKR